MNIKDKLEHIKKYYESISDEELKSRLEKAGFEILEDSPGKIIIDEH